MKFLRIFSSSITLMKISNIPIVLESVTIAFIIGMSISHIIQGTYEEYLIRILKYVVIFSCVIAHEFGHVLMARKLGIKTIKISILPIGCAAMLEYMPTDPSGELRVAAAGPLVSIALVFLFLPFKIFWPYHFIPGIDVFEFLFWINIVITIFNMLPIFPMDGGRISRAVFNSRLGNRLGATYLARKLSYIYIGFLFVLGFLLQSPMIGLILGIVFYLGKREYDGMKNEYIDLYLAESKLKMDKDDRKKLSKDIDMGIKKKFKLRKVLWPPRGPEGKKS